MLNTNFLWCTLSNGNNRYMGTLIINIVIIKIYVIEKTILDLSKS